MQFDSFQYQIIVIIAHAMKAQLLFDAQFLTITLS